MSDFVLKVTPDQLKSKSTVIENQITSFEKSWEQVMQIINNSKGYWIGDASQTHQKAFKVCQEDVQHIIKRLREHPEDLKRMSGIYEKTENLAVGLAQALPTDVIV